jgi:hypothetical protein
LKTPTGWRRQGLEVHSIGGAAERDKDAISDSRAKPLAGQAGGVPMPLYAHRLDLPEAYQAADRLGRLYVAAKIDWQHVRHYTKRWAQMAHKITGVDALGAENRFCWAADDAATQAEQERAEVVRAIKATLRPLIAEHQAWNVLMAEAHEVNGVNDFPLAEADVTEIVRAEVGFALRSAQRGAAHHG